MAIHVYTIRELAQEIGCDHGRVAGWVATGKLAVSQRIGAMRVFDEDALKLARRLLAGDGRGRLSHLYRRLPTGTDQSAYVTKQEAAAAIGIDEATVARWVKAGKLQGYKFAGHERVLLERDAVERLAAARHGERAA